jgi:hypothetical protein
MSNLTLINFFIYVFGSKREDKVFIIIIIIVDPLTGNLLLFQNSGNG